MLFFAKRRWALILVSVGVGLFFAVEVCAITYFQLASTQYQPQVVFVTVAFAAMLTIMAVMYVAWLQKYFYFFKLKRLLDTRVGGRDIECIMSDGTTYAIEGFRPYYVTVVPKMDNTVKVYVIGDDYVSARTRTSTTQVELNEAYFGERELIETRPLAFNQRSTFRHFTRVLDQVSLT